MTAQNVMSHCVLVLIGRAEGIWNKVSSERKFSFNYDDLIECAKGRLFGPGNARLPLPPMLMFDRITRISEEGGANGKGEVEAEFDVKPDLWFFKCHWPNHPNMPAMLQLEAMSQTASLVLFKQDDISDYLYLAEVKNSFFRTEVKPNDTFLVSAELSVVNNSLYSFRCKIKNQKKQIVASAKITLVKPKL